MSIKNLVKLIQQSLPKDADIIRIHSSGDFFNAAYLDAWIQVAQRNPDIIIYGYTKRLDLLKTRWQKLPENMYLVLSLGGKHDHLASQISLPTVKVIDSKDKFDGPVFDIDELSEMHILNGGGDFAIMIHGIQPKGWTGLD